MTTVAVRQAQALGFRSDDIAVIAYPERERSQFAGFDSVGGVSMQRF